MYYHQRQFKYVQYDKVYPVETDDIFFRNLYRWLGIHCRYYPQIWLSKCDIQMTGYQKTFMFKNKNKMKNDEICFAFDVIKGFPISMSLWEMLMNFTINKKQMDDKNITLKELEKLFYHTIEKEILFDGKWLREELQYSNITTFPKNYNDFIKNYLFKETDQVVVPCLNLKSAKKIYCKNDFYRKKMDKKGFIRDRIFLIKNSNKYL